MRSGKSSATLTVLVPMEPVLNRAGRRSSFTIYDIRFTRPARCGRFLPMRRRWREFRRLHCIKSRRRDAFTKLLSTSNSIQNNDSSHSSSTMRSLFMKSAVGFGATDGAVICSHGSSAAEKLFTQRSRDPVAWQRRTNFHDAVRIGLRPFFHFFACHRLESGS